jgi:hypothetical protein
MAHLGSRTRGGGGEFEVVEVGRVRRVVFEYNDGRSILVSAQESSVGCVRRNGVRSDEKEQRKRRKTHLNVSRHLTRAPSVVWYYL